MLLLLDADPAAREVQGDTLGSVAILAAPARARSLSRRKDWPARRRRVSGSACETRDATDLLGAWHGTGPFDPIAVRRHGHRMVVDRKLGRDDNPAVLSSLSRKPRACRHS